MSQKDAVERSTGNS